LQNDLLSGQAIELKLLRVPAGHHIIQTEMRRCIFALAVPNIKSTGPELCYFSVLYEEKVAATFCCKKTGNIPKKYCAKISCPLKFAQLKSRKGSNIAK